MINVFTKNTIRFVLLVGVQVLILSHINFLGYINPYIYILFIVFYPIKNNLMLFILISFLLGLTIDLFLDSGGVHASASVFLAYFRPVILKFCFGTTYEFQTIKFNSIEFKSLVLYISIATIIHHLLLFILEIFNISNILLILQKTLFFSIFTILLSFLITGLFSKKIE